MKFNQKLFLSIVSIIMVPAYLIAAMPFKDVPTDHWAYDAVRELAERGMIEGYDVKTSNQFKGDRTLSRYEFAQALMKMIQKLEAEIGVTKATGMIDEVNVDEVLSKSSLDEKDVELLKKLVKEFQKELADMNLRVNEVETKQRNMELSQPKTPLYISLGAAVLSVVALIVVIVK